MQNGMLKHRYLFDLENECFIRSRLHFFEKCTVILTTGNLDKFTENSWDSIVDIEFSNALKFLPYFSSSLSYATHIQ